jgi:hypothetical protein
VFCQGVLCCRWAVQYSSGVGVQDSVLRGPARVLCAVDLLFAYRTRFGKTCQDAMCMCCAGIV